MDRLSKATRFRVMRNNKSKGTKTTEWKFRSLLMRAGIRHWELGYDKNLPGKPDFIFPKLNLAIFLDGCFWHGCKKCRTIPRTNHAFWVSKINKTIARDKKVVRSLKDSKWRVIRIWEHELKDDSEKVLRIVLHNLIH